jgi:hypothetical protein
MTLTKKTPGRFEGRACEGADPVITALQYYQTYRKNVNSQREGASGICGNSIWSNVAAKARK